MPGDSVRRRIACKSAAASTHPRRTALCAAGRGWGTPWWANICGSPPPSTVGSARAALQLEQVVELGQHQQESQTAGGTRDRKSTRLNSSHVSISYAVFCLKKKKNNI